MEIRFYLNGKETVVNAPPERLLVDVLREDLHLTGTKRGCGEGECGACTVIYNGNAVTSCLMLAGQVDGGSVTMIAQVNGHRVITSEGVESDPRIAPIIPAFVNNMAIQCGYCTPGMVMSAAGLLLHNPDPTEDEIRTAISGNICRCSCYEQILRAIRQAARDMKEAAK